MGKWTDIVAGLMDDDDFDAVYGGTDDFELVMGLADDDDDDDELQLIAGALAESKANKLAKPKGGAAALKRAIAERAIAKKAVNAATLVRQSGPTKARIQPLGFDSESPIEPGDVRDVQSSPQIPIKGYRLIVPSDIAGRFLIRDLTVGNKSQFPAKKPVPARSYQEDAVDSQLDLDTAQVAQVITITVENISSQPSRFFCELKGKVVDY